MEAVAQLEPGLRQSTVPTADTNVSKGMDS